MSTTSMPQRREARACVRWSPAMRGRAHGDGMPGELDLVDVSPFGAGLRDPTAIIGWQVDDVVVLRMTLGSTLHVRSGRVVWVRDDGDGRRVNPPRAC